MHQDTAAPATFASATLGPLLRAQRTARAYLDATTLRPDPVMTWASPNVILLDHPAMMLREFRLPGETMRARRRAAKKAGAIPLLLVAPEINGSNIADYAPDQSFVRTALQAGFGRVAVVHWRSADAAIKDHRIEDSIAAIEAGVDALGGRVHLAGICQGGWEAAIVAARRPETAASLTVIAAAIDFHAGDGALQHLVEAMPQEVYEAFVAAGGGVMRGVHLNRGFTMLKAWERLVVNPWRTWNQLDDPAAMERLDRFHGWYHSVKDLPGPMYLRAVDELFRHNRLVQGTFTLDGEPVDLRRIDCPVAMVAGRRDHITPAAQVFALEDACGSQTTARWELDAGHVGVCMGHGPLREHWPQIFAWLRDAAPDVASADAP